MKRFAVILLLISLIGWWQSGPRDIDLPPGAKAPKIPVQEDLKNAPTFNFKGYQVSPLASFELEAKLLSKKRYRTGRSAELAPYDLALGWGVMSDQTVVDALSIRQTARWYMYRSKNGPLPYPVDVISQHSANMHMVPSNDDILAKLSKLQVGSILRFSGKLVAINHRDGFRWTSSLTRDDRGDGACELFYVDSIDVITD